MRRFNDKISAPLSVNYEASTDRWILHYKRYEPSTLTMGLGLAAISRLSAQWTTQEVPISKIANQANTINWASLIKAGDDFALAYSDYCGPHQCTYLAKSSDGGASFETLRALPRGTRNGQTFMVFPKIAASKFKASSGEIKYCLHMAIHYQTPSTAIRTRVFYTATDNWGQSFWPYELLMPEGSLWGYYPDAIHVHANFASRPFLSFLTYNGEVYFRKPYLSLSTDRWHGRPRP